MLTPSRWLWVVAGLCAGAGSVACAEREDATREVRGSPVAVKYESPLQPAAAEVVTAELVAPSIAQHAETSTTAQNVHAGEVVVVAPPPVFQQAPQLVVLDPQVSVVQDHEVPVYYTERQYWMVRDDGWYHTPRWDQPWLSATVEIIPQVIVGRNHRQYVRYRPTAQLKVWREPNVRYSGPPLFYDPPPLVVVEQDVYVVEAYDAPVYYTSGHYWQHRNNRWYRTARWNEPWVDIEITIVPNGIARRDHHRYVHYRDDRRDHVFRESRRQEARREARRDARDERLVRESRAELRRERARFEADKERRVERRRLALDRERREERQEQAQRERSRAVAEQDRDRRERAKVAAEKDRHRREQAQIAAAHRKEQARIEAGKHRRPTPAAGPPEKRRRAEDADRRPAPRTRVEDKNRRVLPPAVKKLPPKKVAPGPAPERR